MRGGEVLGFLCYCLPEITNTAFSLPTNFLPSVFLSMCLSLSLYLSLYIYILLFLSLKSPRVNERDMQGRWLEPCLFVFKQLSPLSSSFLPSISASLFLLSPPLSLCLHLLPLSLFNCLCCVALHLFSPSLSLPLW